MSTTDTVTVTRDDLETLLWASEQHATWRYEWADSEAQHYPDGEYEATTDDLNECIERVKRASEVQA